MSSAMYDQTVITVKVGCVYIEGAHASVMKFKGYKPVCNDKEKDDKNHIGGYRKRGRQRVKRER